MGIPERLVEVRERNGYTRKRLAEELGKPYATITKYENGEREAGSGYLISIAEKFNVTTDYLLGIEDDQSAETKKSPAPAEAETEEVSLEETDRLLVALGLIKEGEQLSDDDLAFVGHIVGLLDAWFRKRK
ncbi:helix-turn-helix domain-containing protein [Butyricicoccus sp. BIOML-A1]|jgi:transcriptional regulator with XRE-family HTH domain|nr:helix-turn-helix transcriptional regulator [Butyricicoccus sp. BIOML-A1]MZT25665.1 helix-turn-helix domain-containing protein [Butyricicoccus sp. BIOML-A1]